MDKESALTFCKPIPVIKSLLDENSSMLEKLDQVGEYMKSLIGEGVDKVPCINEISVDHVAPYSLVKYRGMVQDMFDPEYYLGKYESKNIHTNEKEMKYGCFTDTGDGQGQCKINFDSEANVTMERQTFYCVPIPGENDWVKKVYAKDNMQRIQHENTVNNTKRRLKDFETEEEKMDEDDSTANQSIEEKSIEAGKRIKDGENQESTAKQQEKKKNLKIDYTKNFPLPIETGTSCFIKMYSNVSEFKLNDIAEFVCILSVDPEFATTTMNSNSKMESEDGMVTWHEFNQAEDQAHCPPPSLVPRLHCLFFNKLKDLNPAVRKKTSQYENASKELTSIRADLMQLLTKVFGGDSLVAEYLLLHLISSLYGRVGTMCVGNFSMNISNCSKGRFTEQLGALIQLFVEKSFYLPLTLDNLNNKRFVPKKDFEANRLTSGILQLSEGTRLILDETKMEPGQLDSDGVRNLTAIGNVIQWQKLDYDFQFNQVDINTNINILVLSEGRSMLKCDCKVPLSSENRISEEEFDLLLSSLSDKLLERIRLYLTIVGNMKYEMNDDVQKALEDDFVEARKEDSKAMSADSFYTLLTVARYMALSHGQNSLSAALWTRVKEMDAKLKQRT